jgi:predicted nucleotidyltransferase
VHRDRIERVMLFGSHAHGDANWESDYDAAVFSNDLTDRWRELDRLADLPSDFREDADAPQISSISSIKTMPFGSIANATAP